ncbi:hypothetical protein QUB19_29790 [Microcoleus sp. B4-C5]|uniref:hypothetical protein n=1 Tax=unclassified Microcoleus TaxID=2642155 RepID=UPI002FD24E7E
MQADYNSALLLRPNLTQAYFNRGAIRLQVENSLQRSLILSQQFVSIAILLKLTSTEE